MTSLLIRRLSEVTFNSPVTNSPTRELCDRSYAFSSSRVRLVGARGDCRGGPAPLAAAAPVRRVDDGSMAWRAGISGVLCPPAADCHPHGFGAAAWRCADAAGAAVRAGGHHLARARHCDRARPVVEHAGGDRPDPAAADVS